MQWASCSVELLRLTTTLSCVGNISKKVVDGKDRLAEKHESTWSRSISSPLLSAEELLWESVLARWRSGQDLARKKTREVNRGEGMLKFDWCAMVSTRAGPCSLTIVRTDSIAAMRSVTTPTFQPFTGVRDLVIAQANLGNVEGDAVTDNVDMPGCGNAVRGTPSRDDGEDSPKSLTQLHSSLATRRIHPTQDSTPLDEGFDMDSTVWKLQARFVARVEVCRWWLTNCLSFSG